MGAQSIKIGVRNLLMHRGWCDIDLLTEADLIYGRGGGWIGRFLMII